MTAPLVERLPAWATAEACAGLLGARPWFGWLDAAADHAGLGRWSYLVAEPWAAYRAFGARTERREGDGPWVAVAGDVLTALQAELDRCATPHAPGAPAFQGGALGYLAYDWGRVLEPRPAAHHADLGLPDAIFGLYDVVLAFDHANGEGWIVSTGLPATGAARAARARERLEALQPPPHPRTPPRPLGDALAADTGTLAPPSARAPSFPVLGLEGAEHVGLQSTFTRRGYLSAVQRVREYILAGDIFQANLSQRFEAPLAEPAGRLYARLRRNNPAPFGAWLAFDDATLLSVSPERFLRLAGRTVETRPIKGTRPRGLGPMHDEALSRELSESDKDRAENVMIVDLLRNDLSRVCRPGTVRVPTLFHLEQHPTVHHLVSTVTGELAPGLGATDLLRATFPGGSITGAPKVRAMQVIAELEPTERGPYCGAIGWLGVTGDMDTSIAIRTCVARGDRVYFSGGGGIVADSDPDLEYHETLHKVKGIVRTLAGRSS
ncbi:MAG: aminodeoxychorismate synthase component I [Gemmatimonadales bacterium]|nr:aminodeoxychorismate synthase component I [Gemmatimonadales bacterium]